MDNISGSAKGWSIGITAKDVDYVRNNTNKKVKKENKNISSIETLKKEAEQLKNKIEKIYNENKHRNLYTGIINLEQLILNIDELN